MKHVLPGLALALALGACAQTPPAAFVPPPRLADTAGEGWQALITKADRARLAELPERWRAALAAVPARQQRQADREGALLDPDAARDHPLPSPGSYDCRLVRLTSAGIRTFPGFFCYVASEGKGALSFTKQTGTELPGGWLHADGDRRYVLTGAMQRTAGDNSLPYGTEPDRDIVGAVERIGPFRWRLVLPARGDDKGLDIYELTPLPFARQGAERKEVSAPASAR